MMMEVGILSKEIVRPSSPAVHHLKSTKLSLLDQLTPTTYVPLILFYPNKTHHPHFKTPQNLSTHLKHSLSETLNSFYPFSGRTKNNLFIDHYDEGVPYNEARVRCHMFDFLQHPETESLNQFLPCHPFRKEPNPEEAAQLAIQVNVFDCGGIAIGVCMSHKIADGTTMSAFLNSWAATTGTGQPSEKLVQPDFSEASSPLHDFPPTENPLLRQILASLVESLWFNEGKYKTRRFVFSDKAISALKTKAKSKGVDNPSRVESLSAFISASAMATSSGFPRPTILAQAVNIRQLTKPCFSDSSMGNLFLWALAACDQNSDSVTTEIQLPRLVRAQREAVRKINRSLRAHGGILAVADCEYLNKIATMTFRPKKYQDIFSFTSWIHFGYNEIDFGWGKPIWVGVLGGVGPALRKLTIFNKVNGGNGIEAWATLDEKEMDILENDPEFLAFATLNPSALGK